MSFVDSTVLVDILRGYPPAEAWFRTQPSLSITPIVWMELIFGAQDKMAQQQATKLLSRFNMVYLTQTDMTWAMQQLATYRLSHSVGISDCLIASVCDRLQQPLFTHNLKHIMPILGTTQTIRPY